MKKIKKPKKASADPFKKVKAVLKKQYKKLKAIPGVKEVGYGYKYTKGARTSTPAVIISVARKVDIEKVPKKYRIPASSSSIPFDVIQINSIEHDYQDPYVLQDPLVGGLSISNGRFSSSGGTMGAIVFEKGTDKPMGLTNHHVLYHNKIIKKSKVGDPIEQPAFVAPTDKTVIGKLARGNENLDCSVFYLNDARRLDVEQSLNGIQGKINGAIDPEPNIAVKKTGARTKVTFGIIDSVFPTYFTILPNSQKPAPNNEISDHGDSGAIWLTDDDQNIAVGLHNRGETGTDPDKEWAAAIKIQLVLKEMNIHF